MIFEIINAHSKQVFYKTILIKGIFSLYVFISMLLLYSLYSTYGAYYVVFVAVIVALNDTGAYFIGSFLKGPPLCKSISPHKTISGFIGGIITAIIGSSFLLTFYHFPFTLSYKDLFFISLFSHTGDLIESAFKRFLGIKDMGSILPGHGGFLDRFDSILLVNYIMYIFLKIFLK